MVLWDDVNLAFVNSLAGHLLRIYITVCAGKFIICTEHRATRAFAKECFDLQYVC